MVSGRLPGRFCDNIDRVSATQSVLVVLFFVFFFRVFF